MADTEDDGSTIDIAPGANPEDAQPWLALIDRAEKAFETWQAKCKSIDEIFASLDRLSKIDRDREFQLFWANVQVLGPSIYSRPPVPVVVPRFKDHKPIPRIASELMERCASVTFDIEDIDEVMIDMRDDITTIGRGVPWLRYSTEGGGRRVCIEHVSRQDFLHDPARKWKEVDWVAKRSWLTRKEARKRFHATSADAYKDAAYEIRKDEITNDTDGKLKAGFWELWSKSENIVVWITEGVDVVLDSNPPHLTLEGFFPCPRPAYATVQRNSLVPVPDMLFYKDQLEEINEITARISSLSEGLRLRGFYPAGAGEIGDAIEAAIKNNSNNQVLIPIANWALLGNGAAKDMIIWLPLEMVAATITQLIQLRKQLIDDVYQITGLSDIMRGSTVASETLGAQQLKSQYGSIRIRDRSAELVRVARDITRIAAEIMAENFDGKTLLEMSQMDIPSDADIAKQRNGLKGQLRQLQSEVQQAQADPEIMQMAQQQPDKAKQVMQQVQQQMQGLEQQITALDDVVTIEKVTTFLRDNRTRCFTLDIETDSTIQPDENAAKQRATEYVGAMTPLIRELASAAQIAPQVVPLAGDIVRYVNGVFRVGREFEQTVDEFVDQMKQMASAPKGDTGPTPEQVKAQADGQRMQMDAAKMQADAQRAQADAQLAEKDLQLRQAIAAKDAQIEQQRLQLEKYKADLSAATAIEIAEIGASQANEADSLEAKLEANLGVAEQEHEQELQASQQAHEAAMQAATQNHQQTMQAAQAAAQPSGAA